MVKKMLLSCAFSLLFYVGIGQNNLSKNIIYNNSLSECNASPPDSFQISTISTNSICLKWIPSWPDAEHTLEVAKEIGSETWEPIDTIQNITGNSYTYNGVQSGAKYKFVIATNCIPGIPSALKKEIDGIALILELTIAGRTPLNPVPANCLDRNYTNPENQWIGFKIGYWSANKIITNLFEIAPSPRTGANGAVVKIKRVTLNHPLVAANELDIWPTSIDPIVKSYSFVKVIQLVEDNGIHIIGNLNISIDEQNSLVSFCPDPIIWDPFFEFTPLTAQKATFISDQIPSNRSEYSKKKSRFWIQSPFNEYLNVSLKDPIECTESISVTLTNQNGQEFYRENSINFVDHFSIQSDHIPPGIYFINIKSKEESYVAKVVKL